MARFDIAPDQVWGRVAVDQVTPEARRIVGSPARHQYYHPEISPSDNLPQSEGVLTFRFIRPPERLRLLKDLLHH